MNATWTARIVLIALAALTVCIMPPKAPAAAPSTGLTDEAVDALISELLNLAQDGWGNGGYWWVIPDICGNDRYFRDNQGGDRHQAMIDCIVDQTIVCAVGNDEIPGFWVGGTWSICLPVPIGLVDLMFPPGQPHGPKWFDDPPYGGALCDIMDFPCEEDLECIQWTDELCEVYGPYPN